MMRATAILLAVVFAGLCLACGGAGTGERSAESSASALPKSTLPATARISDFDVVALYPRVDSRPAKEGQTVLCRISWTVAYGTKSSSGVSMFTTNSEEGFRRPHAVFQLRDSTGFSPGKKSADIYVEGTLKGAFEYGAFEWSKGWEQLAGGAFGPKGYFVLVSDCRIVAPPAD